MTDIKERIKKLSSEYLNEMIRVRRHFHKHPELAFEEFKTAKFIEARLKASGVPFQSGVAKTGIVALIEGTNPSSSCTAIRADMDALPISEMNDIEYKSVNTGVMHACGHDVHMTCLLGAAEILQKIRNDFRGTIKLIFQPSEEKYPGGAITMINEGVLEDPKPSTIFGQHVLPTLESGKIGLRGGKYMASTDEVFLTVKGKGGHAATPELNIDPITISAAIINSLQHIVSRSAPPNIPTVLSFGRIIGDGHSNIIPDEVTIDGTFRTYDEKWRAEGHRKIRSMANSIAESMGAICDVFIDKGYPFLVNDEKVTQKTKELAINYLGSENVIDLEMRMTGEDFAYFSQRVPSCFYRLGIRNEELGIISNLHTSDFNIDENSIETGMGLMAWIAYNEVK
ncbi:M20 family metallopeptidase [Bacteroidota bacterium]